MYFTVESKSGKPVLKGQGFFKHRRKNVGETIPSEDPVSDCIAEKPECGSLCVSIHQPALSISYFGDWIRLLLLKSAS